MKAVRGMKNKAILTGVLATVTLELLLSGIEHIGGTGPTTEIRRGIWCLILGTIVGAAVIATARIKGLESDATGVAKREIAEERLTMYEESHTDIVVGIVDVNGLKKVNDQLGHEAGDELIQEVAHRLRVMGLRHPEILVARMGGDEFIVIAPDVALNDILVQLNFVTHAPHRFGNWPIAAGGVARTRNGSRDVLRCADMAMYRSKEEFYKTEMNCCEVRAYDVVLDGMPAHSPNGDRPAIRLRSELGIRMDDSSERSVG